MKPLKPKSLLLIHEGTIEIKVQGTRTKVLKNPRIFNKQGN